MPKGGMKNGRRYSKNRSKSSTDLPHLCVFESGSLSTLRLVPQYIASMMASCNFFCRFGGEEHLVLLPADFYDCAFFIHGLKLFQFEQKKEQEIIRLELKNTCRTYIDVSTGGHGFTAVLFGIGQLSEESIAGKIAEQLIRMVFDAPHILRMEKEFEPLQKAAVETFCENYPNHEHFLKKV